ncbi:MAG: DNA polymerase III subunit gamma/tau [Cytophagales bacterium]
MKNFVVSARKYRPRCFADIRGQEHVTETLCNAIKNNQVASAFLFCGPRGSGKTTAARLLAKAINCLGTISDGEPCNQCENCTQRTSLNIRELDAASYNSADHIREVIEPIRYRPSQGEKTVIIIDEVHGLSNAALNVLLKPLEDTPEHVVFVLVTTEKRKIIPTILSRCQIFDFRHIDLAHITAQLTSIAQKENITYEPEALALISQKALGSMRDALSIFDLIVTFSGRQELTHAAALQHLNLVDEEIYFSLTKALYRADIGQALLCYDGVFSRGIDSHAFIMGFAQHLRNLLVAQHTATIPLMEVRQQMWPTYQVQAKMVAASFIYKTLSLIQASDVHYKTSANRRLHVEMMLINIGQINLEKNSAKNVKKTSKILFQPKKTQEKPQHKPYSFKPEQQVAVGMVAEPEVITKRAMSMDKKSLVTSWPTPSQKKEVALPVSSESGHTKAKIPYTDREKLRDLATKNPALSYLETRLELEMI